MSSAADSAAPPGAVAPADEALDPHLRLMLAAAAERQGPDIVDLPPPQAREAFRGLKFDAPTHGEALERVRELEVRGAAAPLRARLYVPLEAPQPGAGLVYFHGGGFVLGDLDTHDALCRRLAARSGVRILSVDYRLAPEHRFPAAHDDATAATRWAFAHADALGFDPARIAVGGDSAGGNLAAAAAIELRGDPAAPLAFQLLLYPAVQFGEETESMRRFGEGYFLTRKGMAFFYAALFGEGGPHPRAAVLNAADLASLPPALIVTAGFDPLKDEGAAYAEALRRAGVKAEHREFAALIHGFYAMGGVSPGALAAIDETAEALAAALA